jgi:hypothetical protein
MAGRLLFSPIMYYIKIPRRAKVVQLLERVKYHTAVIA